MKQAVSSLLAAATLVAGVAGAGCSKVSEAATESSSGAAVTAVGLSVATIDNANYRAELVLPQACQHTNPCLMHAVIVAKGDYHINDAYPYKFRVQEPAAQGVQYAKQVVGREDGAFEHKRAVLKVPFSADSAGTAKVGGTLSLSVCSAANCLVDKQALELSAKVD